VADDNAVSPDGFSLDSYYLARPGADDVQLDLFLDFASNVALYPKFQAYFRARRPPFLAVWGRNDPFFLPAGAEAFKRDLPDAEVRFLNTGHFALETHAAEIASAIRIFSPADATDGSMLEPEASRPLSVKLTHLARATAIIRLSPLGSCPQLAITIVSRHTMTSSVAIDTGFCQGIGRATS
jgi:hypothetical protein